MIDQRTIDRRYRNKRNATNDPARVVITAPTGRIILPRSRTTSSQKSTVCLKLIMRRQWEMFPNRGSHGFLFYLTVRRTRLFNISYTPSRKSSFWRRNTGPSSGSIQGHPLVARSGSVAARNTAPATRSTGVRGTPARNTFSFQSKRLVSTACRFFKKGAKVGERCLTREPRVNACRADILAGCDWVQRAHEAQHGVFRRGVLLRSEKTDPGSCIRL